MKYLFQKILQKFHEICIKILMYLLMQTLILCFVVTYLLLLCLIKLFVSKQGAWVVFIFITYDKIIMKFKQVK